MRMITKICPVCGSSYEIKHKYRNSNKYCSHACFTSLLKKRDKVVCTYCSVEFERVHSKVRSDVNFCSRSCKDNASRMDSGNGVPLYAANYKGDCEINYRSRALAFYGERCSVCGYDKDVRMLDVDHKKGRTSHTIENLQVMCVWCHALKTRSVPYHDK